MELCSMKDGGSSCQVEQLANACVSERNQSPCRIHAKGLRPWPGNSITATSTVRHRANRTTAGRCKSVEFPARRQDDAEFTGRVLVTGGAGYFGFRLGRALASRGLSVILLDLVKPRWDIPDGTVFHQLKKEQVESINVGGTSNVIKACLEQEVPSLVYTSTVNVVFAGRPIEDGDEETVPCVPLEMHIDHYSRTKAIAERMVLMVNGHTLKGIYGPEDRRHLHRVMVNVERRLFSFSFGNHDARLNWVHVDNLVMAHILAADGLTARKDCVASGQVYFINDGESVNLFEWLTPLFEKLGYSRPLIHLPFSLVYCVAVLMECLHVALGPVVEIPLIFTRNEVRNIAVSHTFKIEKARRDLGFSPLKYDLANSVDHYLKTRPLQPCPLWSRPQSLARPWALVLLGLLVLLVSLAALLSYSCLLSAHTLQ
ncbi:hypothetical protein SKAU_G00291230 [Synaphobranchus kaupii]|uniref:3-beta hydroxysteroid dehydrogenase/isomerase domain-containing protein n=1 Tax=Synaphobranchus kaupii TaxID=118154 RepID=A0A9Q1ETU3_SYNKA|nr:hypothetical protein SKAU_G00291230 [Synaphobranchus kaupii]